MKKSVCVLIAIGIIFCIGCGDDPAKAMLVGSWKAAAIYENDRPKAVDLSLIRFDFEDNKRYTYQSNADYQEAGRYYVERKLIYTTDTTSAEPVKKSVKIAMLTADSLHLEMNLGGIPQLWQLYRVE